MTRIDTNRLRDMALRQKLEGIAQAILHHNTQYQAIPGYPNCEEYREMYLQYLLEDCQKMQEALNGSD